MIEIRELNTVSLESLVKDKAQAYRLGFTTGRKTSKRVSTVQDFVFKDRGLEFDDVREYHQGDDVRLVDWRMTAKQGKTYTKKFREEVERQVWFLVDARHKMHCGTHKVFKSVVAAHIVAMLSWFFQMKGDKIGGLILSDGMLETFKPSRYPRVFMKFFSRLVSATNQTGTTLGKEEAISLSKACLKLRHSCRTGNLLFILSDFSDMDDQIFKCLASLSKSNELTLIHIYDDMEGRCLPPSGSENPRDNFIYKFQRKIVQLKTFSQTRRIHFISLSTATDFYDVVAKGLQKRKK